jgi:serine phosphatase RsbU (regulator of sigma subunit)
MIRKFLKRLFPSNRPLVRSTWQYVSRLGTENRDSLSEMRSFVLCNQINFILGISMAVLGVILIIRINIIDKEFGIGVLRVWYTFLLAVFNLVLAHLKLHRLSKYSLIFLPPVIFMILPMVTGFVEDEGFTFNSYVLIAASVIPQLILSNEREKVLYRITMAYYLALIISIDFIAYAFQEGGSVFFERIKEFIFIYKLAQVSVYVFINVSIFHLRKVNVRFEDILNSKNSILNDQNHKLREKSEEILRQKEIIEQKSTAISDSINYAAMIQQAVMQPLHFLDDWKLKSFILYKPKAVVSGDFYWGMRRPDGSVVAVAADCTGHGVPGAFMSMLGIALLDEVCEADGSLKPAEILTRLRDQVIGKLSQKGRAREVHDGMDISVCIIDSSHRKLEFAGANNPMYLIRDGNLAKIPADKLPIGIYATNRIPFTDKCIDLKKGDRIYLFSDGFADQFGGPEGKKLMYKNFQDLLKEHHLEPLEEQKESLDKYFESWKGNFEQVDDVLVIGIEI